MTDNNLIFGLEPRHGLPEECSPLEAVAVVKYMDPDGDLFWHIANTRGLNAMECVGMFEAAAFTTKVDVHEAFESEGDDDT